MALSRIEGGTSAASKGGTIASQGNYAKLKASTKLALTKKLAAGGTKGTATAAQKAKAKAKLAGGGGGGVAAPSATPISTPAPIAKLPKASTSTAVAKDPFEWTLEGDPTYQAALAAGQSKFNYSRAQSLAELQNQQTQAAQETQAINENSAEARRRLAGNYAARGMAGGAAGALTLAEAEANARQIAAQTSLKDQIAALNQQYLANYGATGTDWTGTLVGQQYKTEAAQAAINSQLAQRGVTQ